MLQPLGRAEVFFRHRMSRWLRIMPNERQALLLQSFRRECVPVGVGADKGSQVVKPT